MHSRDVMKPSIGSGTTREAALPNAPVMPPVSDNPASTMAACRHKISSRVREYAHGIITMLTTAHQVTGTPERPMTRVDETWHRLLDWTRIHPAGSAAVLVNLDTTPVQLHTTPFQNSDATAARNSSYFHMSLSE